MARPILHMGASVFVIALGTVMLPATSMGSATRTEIQTNLERAAPVQERHEETQNAAGGASLTAAAVPVIEQEDPRELAGGDGSAESSTGAGQATWATMICESPKEPPGGGATEISELGYSGGGGKSGEVAPRIPMGRARRVRTCS